MLSPSKTEKRLFFVQSTRFLVNTSFPVAKMTSLDLKKTIFLKGILCLSCGLFTSSKPSSLVNTYFCCNVYNSTTWCALSFHVYSSCDGNFLWKCISWFVKMKCLMLHWTTYSNFLNHLELQAFRSPSPSYTVCFLQCHHHPTHQFHFNSDFHHRSTSRARPPIYLFFSLPHYFLLRPFLDTTVPSFQYQLTNYLSNEPSVGKSNFVSRISMLVYRIVRYRKPWSMFHPAPAQCTHPWPININWRVIICWFMWKVSHHFLYHIVKYLTSMCSPLEPLWIGD